MLDHDSTLWHLLEQGQSVWLDSIRRGQIKSGELQQLIDQDALRGETANPSIFEKAIAGSSDYDDQIKELTVQGLDANAIYERLATDDVRSACDIFRPLYDQTQGADGFVSLEVSPKLAYDTDGTLAEVRRFWNIVDRPNLMIKIPGTPEGVPAIEQALYEGININITLLFAVEAYEQVAWAYVRALERRAAEGKAIDRMASVASFFVSRIDTLADEQLDAQAGKAPAAADKLKALKGKLAIANAKVAYERFKVIFGDARFQALKTKGARVQRPLWASTSTKNPAYPDTLYVDTLIGPDTINTLPLETIMAFKDHGTVARTIDQDVATAHDEIRQFEELGLSLKAVTDQVLKEGVDKFDKALDQLLQVIEKKCASSGPGAPSGPVALPALDDAISRRVKQAIADGVVKRLWQRDPSLWSDKPETQAAIRDRLGWLTVVPTMRAHVDNLTGFAREIVERGYRHVLLLGMGGSSLAPEVLEYTFGIAPEHPNFAILDTTDPVTVSEYLREMNPEDALYLISSKSGLTVETHAFFKYFYEHACEVKGDRAGRSFVAITDLASPLENLAEEHHFRKVFSNPEDIVGRYSALSYVGLVPAALMGIDLGTLLDRAEEMMRACGADVPESQNPGLRLGLALGELESRRRDKITLVLSPEIRKFGYWLEQLLAESTGKLAEKGGQPHGLVPIEGEALGAPEVYGDDRAFVYLRLENTQDTLLDAGIARLEQAGLPVIRLQLKDAYSLGGEFFRWMFATAIAGYVIGINPFNEPNVDEGKTNTRRALDAYVEAGRFPPFKADAQDDGIVMSWSGAQSQNGDLVKDLHDFLSQTRPGDYIAILAYLTHSPAGERAFATLRATLRDHFHVPVTLGYGPRYLHSTGQLHKGGPNEGLFIVLTSRESQETEVPGEPYTFGALFEAQALGDIQALQSHGRRVLRLHLSNGTDVTHIGRVFQAALKLPASAPA